ncbi:MAG: hypothetical protein WDO12_07925 [Pseudomonadota bacterium]
MNVGFKKTQVAFAVAAAIGGGALAAIAPAAVAAKTPGQYVAGDIHNHTTCSDGSISMEKLIKKATDTVDTPWGLDWFVQAGHGGSNGTSNCTLVEDASLGTPAYPYVAGQGPTTSWLASGATLKGHTFVTDVAQTFTAVSSTNSCSAGASPTTPVTVPAGTTCTDPSGTMYRWQTLQEYQYPVTEYLAALRNKPLFVGQESVVAGHEHSSLSVITGQMPASVYAQTLPSAPPYTAIGNVNALAQWTYCFDAGQSDPGSRGGPNNWDCSIPGSSGPGSANWGNNAARLTVNAGTGGHLKTVEAVKWIQTFHPGEGYYLPTHLERAGAFKQSGNSGFDVNDLRDFNNTAPGVAFGFETQPGHHASGDRGEYSIARQADDSIGGTTWGGTGIYGALVGGVWDAMLGEGRAYWFFASSDWHNRGSFTADDRRSTADFLPGEYQRAYSLVRNNGARLNPQLIVDGMRSGNSFSTMGQLIDRLSFVACASYPGLTARTNALVESWAVAAANGNKDIDQPNCATMGEKLKVTKGAEIVVTVVVRDPAGANFAPYTFNNPSLLQAGIEQPLDHPVLDHVDLIRGMVTSGIKTSASADYAARWPDHYINTTDMTPAVAYADLPNAVKNPTTSVIKTFSAATAGSVFWTPVTGTDGQQMLKMTYRIPATQVQASQYVRLRGTNLPPATPWETDASGNPLADLATNGSRAFLKIPCNTTGTTEFNGCPSHLAKVGTQKYVSYDVAAWSDLWFYSNPIFVEVAGSQVVQGVQ